MQEQQTKSKNRKPACKHSQTAITNLIIGKYATFVALKCTSKTTWIERSLDKEQEITSTNWWPKSYWCWALLNERMHKSINQPPIFFPTHHKAFSVQFIWLCRLYHVYVHEKLRFVVSVLLFFFELAAITIINESLRIDNNRQRRTEFATNNLYY